VSFATLILHNVTVKKLRLALTALAVAIGVLAVVSLGVVTHSLETSDLALLKTGQADFTIAQKGVADLLSSSIDARSLARIRAVPGVAGVTGVLIGTERLNAANPQFLQIGIDPADLAAFGVTVVAGRPFAASATNELMLGWRAAENLGLHAGDTLRVGTGPTGSQASTRPGRPSATPAPCSRWPGSRPTSASPRSTPCCSW
jgi:putative ABC transport system permease protein